MKQKLLTFIISLAITIQAGAQERTVENRPYTDLRPFHFGVLVGTHFQDIEFQNAGLVTYLDADGIEQQSCVTVDQDRWDTGFTVGVLGEFRLNTHFQLRIAPAMYFGTRHLSFYNMLKKDGAGNPIQQKQEMKTAYICSTEIQQSPPIHHGRNQPDDESEQQERRLYQTEENRSVSGVGIGV